MRHAIIGTILAALLAACAPQRYVVDRNALEGARRREEEAVPAQALDGRRTWLRLEAIDAARPLGEKLVLVDAADVAAGWKTAGLLALGSGGLVAFSGRLVLEAEPQPGDDPYARLGNVYGGLFLIGLGGALMAGGIAFLAAGFLTEGPELPAPPSASAVPPRR